MKTIKILLGAIAVLALVGCSSTRVRSDFDERSSFTSLRTYTWIDQPVRTARNPALNNPLLTEHVQNAVDGQLASQGFRRLDSGAPDFKIAYHVVADEKTEVTVQDSYYGRRYGHGLDYYTQEYVKGTLILDIYDGTTNKLIWRGWATKALSDNPKPKKVQRYVKKAVKKILKEFPPTT
jgi:hypothetical protein